MLVLTVGHAPTSFVYFLALDTMDEFLTFFCLSLLQLYLLGRSSLNCENRSETMMRGGRKTLKLFLCFIPTFLAAWVAVTRTIDNWHHYADILAGSIIGAGSACIAYSFNYASVFHSQHAGVPLQGCHLHGKVQTKAVFFCSANGSSQQYYCVV